MCQVQARALAGPRVAVMQVQARVLAGPRVAALCLCCVPEFWASRATDAPEACGKKCVCVCVCVCAVAILAQGYGVLVGTCVFRYFLFAMGEGAAGVTDGAGTLASGRRQEPPRGTDCARQCLQFPPQQDAVGLLLRLHGDLLRAACSGIGQHQQGLAQVARRCRLTPRLARKCRELDAVSGWLRHITAPKATAFIEEVLAAMRESLVNPAERDFGGPAGTVWAAGPHPNASDVASSDATEVLDASEVQEQAGRAEAGSASQFDVATFVHREALDADRAQGQAGRAEVGRASLCDDPAMKIGSAIVSALKASEIQVQAGQAEVGRASLGEDAAVGSACALNASECLAAGHAEVGSASHFDVATFVFSEALDAGKVQGRAGRAEVGRASLCDDVVLDVVPVAVANTTQAQAGHAEVGRATLCDDSAVYNGSAFVSALNASEIQVQAGRAEVGRASLCDDAALDIGFAIVPALNASEIQVQAVQAEVGRASPCDVATSVSSEALDAGKVQGQARRAKVDRASLRDDVALEIVSSIASPLNASEFPAQAGQAEVGSANDFDAATFVFSEALDAGKVQGQAGRAEVGRASLCDEVAQDVVSLVVAIAPQVQAGHAEVGRASLCDDCGIVSALNASEIQGQAGRAEVGRASLCDDAALDIGFASAPALKASRGGQRQPFRRRDLCF